MLIAAMGAIQANQQRKTSIGAQLFGINYNI